MASPQDQEPSKFWKILFVLARIIYLGFAVLAFLSLPEARKLLDGTYKYDASEKTLYIPLVICTPTDVDVQGTVVSFDAADLEGCFALDFLVNACAVSLLLSGTAMVVFLIIDALTRCGKGPFKSSSLAGMGLFLIFILLQTGFCTGALTKQADFWREHNENLLELLNDDNSVSFTVDKVETYGNTTLLLAAALVSFVTSLVVFCEVLVALCCRSRSTDPFDNSATKSLSVLNETAELNTSALPPSSLDESTSVEMTGELNLGSEAQARPSWTSGV